LAGWFWRRRFLNIFCIFLLFRDYLPLERGYPLSLNKLESPLSKDDLCQVWLKLAHWFWRRFFNHPFPFLHFCYYLPFEEDLDLYLNKLEFPSPKVSHHPKMAGNSPLGAHVFIYSFHLLGNQFSKIMFILLRSTHI
jgi:hypothetical protein